MEKMSKAAKQAASTKRKAIPMKNRAGNVKDEDWPTRKLPKGTPKPRPGHLEALWAVIVPAARAIDLDEL